MNIRHFPKLIAIGASAAFLICAVAQNSDPGPKPPPQPEKATTTRVEETEGDNGNFSLEINTTDADKPKVKMHVAVPPEPPAPIDTKAEIARAKAELERAQAIAERAKAEAEKLTLQPLAPVRNGEAVKREKGFPFIHFENDDSDSNPGKSSEERFFELLFPVVVVAIVFSMPIVLIALILIYRSRKNRLFHKTIQTLVEKGQPIPPELLANQKALKPQPTNASDRRKGIIWTCVGGGLTMFFLLSGDGPRGLGFIPLAIGIGYLLVAKFAPRGPDGL